MIKVVTTTPQHYVAIKPKDSHKSEIGQIKFSDGITVVYNEEPLAIFGGFLITPDVMQGWGIVSKEVNKYPISFHRTMKDLIPYIMNKTPIRRLQISVRVDLDNGFKWANKLGFVCEGRMRNYGRDGSDYYLFARVT